MVLDLFCGAGGLSLGFSHAGFSDFLGVDFDDAALLTYERNIGNAKKLDLFRKENIETLSNLPIDILIGGPPCQGFSVAGKRDPEDKRNKLYEAMVEVAKNARPGAVVLENVPGIFKNPMGKKILEDFSGLGYEMNYRILYGPDYGIPQIRKRVFFVGLPGKKFDFPECKLPPISCMDAIGDLPSLQTTEGFILPGEDFQAYPVPPQNAYQEKMRKDSPGVYNHIAVIPTPKVRNLIALVPEGKNHKALPEEYQGLYHYNEALKRYHSKRPSLTIDTGHRCHFHYRWNRVPTVRENARLQSFPDTFIFSGNKNEQYRQVGNAVPPLFAEAIAKKMLFYTY